MQIVHPKLYKKHCLKFLAYIRTHISANTLTKHVRLKHTQLLIQLNLHPRSDISSKFP
jgi:hypothetical protein